MRPMQKQRRAIAIAAIAAIFVTIGSFAVGQTQQQQAPVASSKLNLTMEQRHIIREVVKGLKVESEPRNMQISVGEVIPKTVQLRPMPADVSDKVSQIKSHLFFLQNDKVVLVDPKDNKIVDVIELR